MDCLALQTSHYFLSSCGSLPLGVSKHSLFFFFFSFPPSPCFSFFACLQQAFNLELLEVQGLNRKPKTWFVSVWLQWLSTNSNLWGKVGTCVFCCRWASGAFQSEEFDADTDTVSNTKACCSHYLLPCSFMFSLFFVAHFMIGNLDFMQVSRCISVCRENPNSRTLLKKERKKAPCPSIPGFRVQECCNDDGFVCGLLQGCVGYNCCVSRLLLASGASDVTPSLTSVRSCLFVTSFWRIVSLL